MLLGHGGPGRLNAAGTEHATWPQESTLPRSHSSPDPRRSRRASGPHVLTFSRLLLQAPAMLTLEAESPDTGTAMSNPGPPSLPSQNQGLQLAATPFTQSQNGSPAWRAASPPAPASVSLTTAGCMGQERDQPYLTQKGFLQGRLRRRAPAPPRPRNAGVPTGQPQGMAPLLAGLPKLHPYHDKQSLCESLLRHLHVKSPEQGHPEAGSR